MASYLKAIGVLRLIAEQKDPAAKGHWEAGKFILSTSFDRGQISEFFCRSYCPTAIVDPWNGGSGFYPKDDTKGVTAILQSNDRRFSTYRDVISKIKSWTDIHFDKTFRTDNKHHILSISRARLPDEALPWIDAAYVLRDRDQSFTPALGTGGNEGRLEMSNNFMQRLVDLLLSNNEEKTCSLLEAALFEITVPGLSKASIGQLHPGRAGGFNQGMGIEQKEFKINPWDYVLMMEGSVALAGTAVRRYPTQDRSQFTSPFTVRFSQVGFSSSAAGEKGVYETWLPLWKNPASWQEVRHLFGEGRVTIGRKTAASGLDFSRAVGTLGTDRGIESFERYAFLRRRGKSNVALPAGHIPVKHQPLLELLNELDPILLRLRIFLAAFKNVPASFASADRNLQEAIFGCCMEATSERFIKLARALGRIEQLIATRDRNLEPAIVRPLYGLSPRWVEACDDGSAEVRIAASIASVGRTGKVGTIRSTIAGTKPEKPDTWGEAQGHWHGSNLLERMATILTRRLMEAEQKSEPAFPLHARLSVNPDDVMVFIRGECDDVKIEDLLWAFTLVTWQKGGAGKISRMWIAENSREPLSSCWCLLKLLHTPHTIVDKQLRREPRIVGLLKAGRTAEACEVAIRRLYVSGLKPYRVRYEDDRSDPLRLLASLLIPTRNQSRLEAQVLELTTDGDGTRRMQRD